ncbi:MAG: CBASS oligonucleotide cyclase [Xenococcus sp. (in: cyanobacteria)]
MVKVQKRLSNFVNWIATESEKEDEIRKQSNNIRERISVKAKEDGITVKSTPNAGSFAKRTGLRRHLRGHSVVEGQDVDLPFVITRPNDETLNDLLDRFLGYAKASYPKNIKEPPTKSSVKLEFSNSKLSYDLVPMIATEDNNRQIIMRSNGEEFETSVQGHIAFIKDRTKDSKSISGRVEFNECVRLIKWWKEFRVDESYIFDEVPSMVIELLCGKLYDLHEVEYTYADTLAKWFGKAAHLVRQRKPIYFNDDFSSNGDNWEVIIFEPRNEFLGKLCLVEVFLLHCPL